MADVGLRALLADLLQHIAQQGPEVRDAAVVQRARAAISLADPPAGIMGFLDDVAAELVRARAKFPGPNANLAALHEESGEVARAMLSESRERVRAECVQCATMAARVALEGDPTLEHYRQQQGLS